MIKFFRRPTIIEWIVLAAMAIGVCFYFFAPPIEEGVDAARKRQAEADRKAAP
ncbi:MAG TPA: hypothetical protein VGJ26_10730 [Pirellulales bacterium]|jgi:hypothetical protein